MRWAALLRCEPILFKAELCIAVVRRRYVGKRQPCEETVENGARRLMELPWADLFSLARTAGVRAPHQVQQRFMRGK